MNYLDCSAFHPKKFIILKTIFQPFHLHRNDMPFSVDANKIDFIFIS